MDRLVQDGSALCEASGSAGATGKLTALYAFGSLSRCFSVLCADRSAWRDAPRTSLLCLALPR